MPPVQMPPVEMPPVQMSPSRTSVTPSSATSTRATPVRAARLRTLFVAVLLAAPLPGGWGAAAQQTSTDVVATWRGGSLTRGEYDSWRTYRGLEDSPGTIRELVFVHSMATAGETRASADADDLRTRLELEVVRRNLLLAPLRDRIEATATVRDEEVEDLLRAHPEAFHQARRLLLRNLYKRLGKGGEAGGVRARMEEIHHRLREGADFETLARTESESQTRFRGGRLGFVTADELPPPVAEAVRDLEPGEISAVVEYGNGLSIFRCDEVREARDPTRADQRAKVHARLLRQRRKQVWADFIDALWEAAETELHPASETTVLEMEGYRLTAAGLSVLFELQGRDAVLGELDTSAVESFLRTWGREVLAVRRAIELGLDREPEIAAALHWKRIEARAHRELVRRIDARLGEPGEKELRRFFAAEPERFRHPPSYEIAVLRFPLGEGATRRERVEAARRVERRLAGGELTFAEAARRHSNHPTAAAGGYLGWIPRSRAVAWGPVVTSALRQMRPGDRSGLLRLESALWIFELRGERPARAMTFEEAEPQITRELRRQQIRRLERRVREEQLEAIGAALVDDIAEPPDDPPRSSPSPSSTRDRLGGRADRHR